MRPIGKEPDYEPRQRPPRSGKKGRKRFAIEYRWRLNDDPFHISGFFRRRFHWTVWRRYHTEKQRDQALQTMRAKKDGYYVTLEYRKEAPVKIRPLHDKVIVEYVEPKTKTDGGILLPDICKDPPTEAVVLKMGPGKRASNGELIPIPFQVGDKVLVCLSGIELENPDPDSQSKIRMLDAEDILGVDNNERC